MSGKPFEVRSVAPIGERTSACFVDYADGTGELKEMTFKVYPDSIKGEVFRDRRVDAELSLMAAGKLLGLSPAEVCGLGRGSHEFVDAADWEHANNAMDRAALARKT